VGRDRKSEAFELGAAMADPRAGEEYKYAVRDCPDRGRIRADEFLRRYQARWTQVQG
jgi:hypothetical protein